MNEVYLSYIQKMCIEILKSEWIIKLNTSFLFYIRIPFICSQPYLYPLNIFTHF